MNKSDKTCAPKNKLLILTKTVRVITVPPIMAFYFLMVLYAFCSDIFKNSFDLAIAIICFSVIPVLSYLICAIVPKLRKKGRDMQRSAAFIANLIGYTLGILYAAVFDISEGLRIIFLTYFISVVILTVFNKVLKFRASGHACCISAPFILLIYFIGAKCIAPCVLIYVLIFWSSVVMKRHTPKELIYGTFCAVIAFFVSICVIFAAKSARALKLLSFEIAQNS